MVRLLHSMCSFPGIAQGLLRSIGAKVCSTHISEVRVGWRKKGNQPQQPGFMNHLWGSMVVYGVIICYNVFFMVVEWNLKYYKVSTTNSHVEYPWFQGSCYRQTHVEYIMWFNMGYHQKRRFACINRRSPTPAILHYMFHLFYLPVSYSGMFESSSQVWHWHHWLEHPKKPRFNKQSA